MAPLRVFGKLGEFAGTLKKGAHLQVEGELRSREYETKKVGKKPAQKKTIWEIRVNSILKLDRAEKAARRSRRPNPTSSGSGRISRFPSINSGAR
jgi:single-strand DNA-binding protein